MRIIVIGLLAVVLAGCADGGRGILDVAACELQTEVDEGDIGDYYACEGIVGAASHTFDVSCDGAIMVGAEAERAPLPNGTAELVLMLNGEETWRTTLDPQRSSGESGDEAWHYVEEGGTGWFTVTTSADYDGHLGFGYGCS